ncbi:bifunctional diguanylate cyclase/phosphodiesterase [Rubrivivax albus]|uniref:EAL domain-containing protein n=1 Tax=Rubrivivax albus TaxID=2499835 RepID=A0A3S2TLR2_9BURK|nr:EAL domain-containing protein [Rubrivivax albus]RVT50474.1 EAL domain-containing protein [Rubrivivax albus]
MPVPSRVQHRTTGTERTPETSSIVAGDSSASSTSLPRPDEAQRLAALQATELLDTAEEQSFDDLTALAAEILDVPIALVSLVDEQRQWFKSHHGLPARETPREWAFCAHAIQGDGIFEVPDAAADPRFRNNPLVVQDPRIRFYAGMPLRLPTGEALGTLCVIDRTPRRLEARQRDALVRLARQASHLIELHRSRLEQHRTSRELRRLALVAQRTDNVVILGDTEGRTTWVNAAFERVTGYSADEVIGRTPGSVLQFEGSAPAAREALGHAVRARKACRVQILNRSKGGRPYWMDVDLQPLHGEDGTFEGFVAVETDVTEVVRQREHAQALLDALPAGVLLQSRSAAILRANPAAHDILGMPPGGLVGRDTRAARWLTVDAEGQPLRDEDRPLTQVLATGRPTEPRRIGVHNGQGQRRWLDLRCVPLRGPDGELEAALTCFTDITDAVRTDGMLQTALGAADLGSWTWDPDDDQWTLSPNWVERFGPLTNEGRWLERVHPDDLPMSQDTMLALLRGTEQRYRAEFRLRMRSGAWHWLLAYAAVAERAPNGRVLRVSGVLMDINERKRAEERLRAAATTDALTGLPNRSLLADRVGQALASCRRRRRLGALIFLDLDHFKRVNDSHGHAAGDALLCEVTRRLRDTLRVDDTLARMGGDELMVLLPDAGADPDEAERAAREVVRKLRVALDVPVQVGLMEYRVGASIGITVFPRDDTPTVDDLVREADTAMYAAKQAERGSTRLYEPAMHEHVASRVAMERALRQAIDDDAITLHLQGQWTSDGTIAGLEALARWHDPDQGMVPPAQFISVAEDSGLILPLGRRMIEQACALACRLRDAGVDVPLAVNVSPRQFADPGFTAHLVRTVGAYGISPRALQLELTESMLADDASEQVMKHLAAEGFRFSIDDFGTGWSNLLYLKRLPVHELKIDRAFVRDLVEDADDAALVLAIIGIARRFGIQTVAEGVETAAQARFLVEAGCDRLQGWLFDRARPIDEVLASPLRRPAVADAWSA